MKALVPILLAWHAFNANAQQARIELGNHASLLLERRSYQADGKPMRWKMGDQQPLLRGKPVFGTDGEMPRFVLAAAVLVMEGKSIQLDTQAMYNPWFGAAPNPESYKLVRQNNSIRLLALFSDGAGTYLAEWQITNGVAKRVVLTSDEEVVVSHFYRRPK